MRKIKRIYRDYDPVNSEHWSAISDALLIGNKVIVWKDSQAVSFEYIPYLQDDANSVDIKAGDKSVLSIDFDLTMIPGLATIDLSEMLGMTVIELVNEIFKRMGATI
ncbi:hypothetical protein [Heyndrickxia ginsengihumi]|uniref:hypothetical protein n=1 Tax=Heyndrickxia ginsengihumi TaxID=363870 RepID=UPI003D237BCC